MRNRETDETIEEGPGVLSAPICRRAVFAGLGLALISPMAPAPAIAWPGVGGGWYSWGGGSNGGVLANGRGVGFCNGWQADWQCSNTDGNLIQRLRVALGMEVTSDYSNDLYTHVVARPLMACGDDNLWSAKRLWFQGGEDNRGTLYRDGQEISKFQGDLLNIELGEGKGRGWNTGFKDYAFSTPSFWTRRARDQVSQSFTAKVDISEVYAKTGGNWHYISWPSIYTTLWLGVDLHQKHEKIKLRNRADLLGLIVEVRDAAEASKLLEADRGGTAARTQARLRARTGAANQNWMVKPGGTDELGGQKHLLAAMHVKGLPMHLNEDGGGSPSTAPSSPVQLWENDGTRACEWWAHSRGGNTLLVCDGTGRLLDRAGNSHAEGTAVQAHSTGYSDQWDNAAQQWKIVEAVFGGSIRLPDEALRPGSTARCPDPRPTCAPRRHTASRDEGLDYIYRWYCHEEAVGTSAGSGTITGQAHISGLGDKPEAPAHGHVGLPHLGKALESFRLVLKGWGVAGGIAYETDRGATGADGSWCGPRGASYMFGGIRVRLTGEAAKHADLAYRVFRSGIGWSETVYSTGRGAAPLAGGAWDGSHAVLGIWVMPIPKPRGAIAVREFSTDPSYKVDADALEGLGIEPKFLTCGVMLAVRGTRADDGRVFTDRYRGAVLSSAQPLSLSSTVTAYADGEVVGTFKFRNGTTPVVPAEVSDAARRENCTSWEGWFTDAGCTQAWKPAPREGDFSIYSYNTVTVDFAPTSNCAPLDGAFHLAPDASSAAAAMVPSPVQGRWRREMALSLPAGCFRDDGDGHWATMRAEGYFGDVDGATPPLNRISPERDTTLYIRWVEAIADGVESMLAP